MKDGYEYDAVLNIYHKNSMKTMEKETKTVYEFLGCRFHGHECMKDRNKYDPRSNSSLENVYQRTQLRLQEIRDKGYHILLCGSEILTKC